MYLHREEQSGFGASIKVLIDDDTVSQGELSLTLRTAQLSVHPRAKNSVKLFMDEVDCGI